MSGKPYVIREVERLPKIKKIGLYDQIIDEFLKSGFNYCTVEIPGRASDVVHQGLQGCIVRRHLEGKVRRILHESIVYLERLSI